MLFLLLTGLLANAFAFEQDLTVEVGAGKMECFFQPIKKPTGVEVEYQVILPHPLSRNYVFISFVSSLVILPPKTLVDSPQNIIMNYMLLLIRDLKQ